MRPLMSYFIMKILPKSAPCLAYLDSQLRHSPTLTPPLSSSQLAGTDQSVCEECTPGKYCPDAAMTQAGEECAAGCYCIGTVPFLSWLLPRKNYFQFRNLSFIVLTFNKTAVYVDMYQRYEVLFDDSIRWSYSRLSTSSTVRLLCITGLSLH